MDRRLKFDEELRDLQIEALGYQHTYFEPTESVRLQYDAVIYKRSTLNVSRADNHSYTARDVFDVTIISRDPETTLPAVFQWHFARCNPGKFFIRDNLYHFPFTIIY